MDKLLELIKEKGFDLKDIASLLDVSKDKIAEMFNGKIKISTSQLAKIADFLNIDAADILKLVQGDALKNLGSLCGGDDKKESPLDKISDLANLFGKK